MNDSPCSAAVRRRRIITDALLLLFLLVLLVASLSFPIPTIGAALRAAQQEILFGPGEIVAEFTRDELPRTLPILTGAMSSSGRAGMHSLPFPTTTSPGISGIAPLSWSPLPISP